MPDESAIPTTQQLSHYVG